jgi:hypothetical protein
MGGIAAPLLAGFSLTLLGLVIQVEDELRWPDLALLLLSVAIAPGAGGAVHLPRPPVRRHPNQARCREVADRLSALAVSGGWVRSEEGSL